MKYARSVLLCTSSDVLASRKTLRTCENTGCTSMLCGLTLLGSKATRLPLICFTAHMRASLAAHAFPYRAQVSPRLRVLVRFRLRRRLHLHSSFRRALPQPFHATSLSRATPPPLLLPPPRARRHKKYDLFILDGSVASRVRIGSKRGLAIEQCC